MNKLKKLVKRIDWHQKKWFASWHTWAGLIAGSILIITAITGALLVFEQEIDVAMNSDLFEYKPQGERLSFEEATKRAKEQYPNLNYLGIYRIPELNDIYMLNVLREGYKLNDKKFKQIFVNPYNGEVSGIRIYENTFIGLIREIHTSLLIPKIGKYLVGISSLTCLMLIITGLRLWIPKTWQQVKGSFKIAWRKSSKKLNYDLHKVLGVYFSPIITMLSLSGAMISFAQFFMIFLFLISG